jgi:hypothetical protein
MERIFRGKFWLAAVFCCAMTLQSVPAWAAETKPAATAPAKVKFRPPSSGAPSVRLTGGSRGTGEAAITLDVLAPDDVGLTTLEQPSLFWYQSAPSNARFELTVLQEKQVKPLLQVKENRASKAGIQRLRLSDHGVRLARGIEYQWVVALITDVENRSTDLVASGVIKRVEPSAELKKSVEAAGPGARGAAYAEAGIWYDALAALSDSIEAEPGNKALEEARADLLRQGGLKGAVTGGGGTTQ